MPVIWDSNSRSLQEWLHTASLLRNPLLNGGEVLEVPRH